MESNTGVIVARFQTPYLHEGHIELIRMVQEKHNKLIVVLGVSPIVGSRRNPYDYHTREKMIKKEFADVLVLPLSDHPSDKEWSRNLDNLLTSAFPSESFLLYGSRDSFIPYYFGKFKTVELPEHGDHNATELRKKYADKVFDSRDFRAGILYAYHLQYTKVYPTVDVAVFRNGKKELLLGKKSINNKWRLIGGFSDPEDDSFEMAAKRELVEECGPIEVGELTYEMSTKINDWRYRNEADKIITTVYSCDLLYGTPQAQDDIVDVQWFPLPDVLTLIDKDEVTPEHRDLMNTLIAKYN